MLAFIDAWIKGMRALYHERKVLNWGGKLHGNRGHAHFSVCHKSAILVIEAQAAAPQTDWALHCL